MPSRSSLKYFSSVYTLILLLFSHMHTHAQPPTTLEYTNWWSSHVHPLASITDCATIDVSENEAAIFRDCLNKAFPGNTYGNNDVILTLKLKKHLEQSLGIHCDNADIDNTYKKWFTDNVDASVPLVDASVPLKEELSPLIEVLAFFTLPRVKEFVNDKSAASNNKADSILNRIKFWNEDDLHVDLPDDYCLAQHRDSAACLLTAGKFNSMVRHFNVVNFIPRDSARAIIIKNILTDDYICAHAAAKGYIDNDSINRLKSTWLSNAAYMSNYKGIHNPVTDEGRISEAYERYYDQFFAPKTRRYHSIIGSNDSIIIDSLWKQLGSDSLNGSPWSYSSKNELPIEFLSSTDTLTEGNYTSPLPTPFGYFIIRLDSIVRTPEISYDEGRRIAMLIASRQKWHNLDSLVLSKAACIFNSDDYFKNVYDTLRLEYILLPQAAENTTRRYTDSISVTCKSLLSTFSTRSSSISSSYLYRIVPSLRKRIHAAPVDSSKIIGPLASPLGIWFIKKRSHAPGKRELLFSDVRTALVDSILTDEILFGEGMKYLQPDSLTKRFALARVCSQDFFTYTIHASRKPGSSSNADTTRHVFAENRIALNTWLDKIEFKTF